MRPRMLCCKSKKAAPALAQSVGAGEIHVSVNTRGRLEREVRGVLAGRQCRRQCANQDGRAEAGICIVGVSRCHVIVLGSCAGTCPFWCCSGAVLVLLWCCSGATTSASSSPPAKLKEAPSPGCPA